MLKIILCPALILLSALAFGQTPQLDSLPAKETHKRIALGLQYGMSWNDARFSPNISPKVLSGSKFGLVFVYMPQKNTGIQAELSSDSRGWQERIDTLASAYERRINYVDLGFLTRLAIGRGRVQPVLTVGPYLGYLTSSTEDRPSDWPLNRGYYGLEPEVAFQYGLTGGLGVAAGLGPVLFQLEGRYRYAFNNWYGSELFTFSQSRGFLAQAALMWRF